jgi:serine/threonine protein phosphatase PrpC
MSKLITDKIEDGYEMDDDTSLQQQYSVKSHPAQSVETPGQVVSIWGSIPRLEDKFVPYFAQKNINFDGDLSRMRHRVGIVSHRGLKPESPNQDDFFVLARKERIMFGVLDGHGPLGHDVAHFAQEHLPKLIMERLRQDGEAWSEAVTQSVKELVTKARAEVPDKAEISGTTVSIAMLDREGGASEGPMRLRCAYLGDSIAICAKRKGKEPWQVTQLTDIHRPDREDEAKRIEEKGGKVREGRGAGNPARLLTTEWNLAMSRSFGDFHAVPFGLSNEPEFSGDEVLEPDEQHLVLVASDGVWDVIPPAQAVQLVAKFKPDEAQLAVEKLIAKAQLRWQQQEDVVDDITAVLIWPDLQAQDAQEE